MAIFVFYPILGVMEMQLVMRSSSCEEAQQVTLPPSLRSVSELLAQDVFKSSWTHDPDDLILECKSQGEQMLTDIMVYSSHLSAYLSVSVTTITYFLFFFPPTALSSHHKTHSGRKLEALTTNHTQSRSDGGSIKSGVLNQRNRLQTVQMRKTHSLVSYFRPKILCDKWNTASIYPNPTSFKIKTPWVKSTEATSAELGRRFWRHANRDGFHHYVIIFTAVNIEPRNSSQPHRFPAGNDSFPKFGEHS